MNLSLWSIPEKFRLKRSPVTAIRNNKDFSQDIKATLYHTGSFATGVGNIQKACTSGVKLVQLPLKNISEIKFLKIANKACEIKGHFQTRLIINDNYKIAKEVKADGVHLGKTDSCPTVARIHLYS